MHLKLIQQRYKFVLHNLEVIFDKVLEEEPYYGFDLLAYPSGCQLPYDDVRTTHFVIQYPYS